MAVSSAAGKDVSLTIRDAARATGLTAKAIARRIERGTLEHTLVDGVRHIPLSALVSSGLLVAEDAAPPPPPRREERRPAPSLQPEVVTALLRRIAGLEARVVLLEKKLAGQESDG